MKRTTPLVGLLAIVFGFGVGILTVPDNAEQQEDFQRSPRCREDGWQDLARSESRWVAFTSERDCALFDVDGGALVAVTVPALFLNFHPGESAIEIIGTSFHPDSPLVIDVHVHSHGVIGAPYSLASQADANGDFTSDLVSVSCPEPGWSVYVIATDHAGVAHADSFSLDELVCEGASAHV